MAISLSSNNPSSSSNVDPAASRTSTFFDSGNAVKLDQWNRWSSLKQLHRTVCGVIANGQDTTTRDLESSLRRFRTDFLTLLKNPPKTTLHKELVINAVKDGINIMQRRSVRTRLPVAKVLVEEALLMSDMFDLNELISLELLITGDYQVPRFPGTPRGPVAVLLYYDARKSLLASLKCLLEASSGKSWSAQHNNVDLGRIITNFVKGLVTDGIVERALEALTAFNPAKELELLARNKALGPGKFKKQLFDMIREIHELYGYIIFCFAAQFDLTETSIKGILKYVMTKSVICSESCDELSLGIPATPLTHCKSLDAVSTYVTIAYFYAIDATPLEISDRANNASKTLSVVKHPRLLKDLQAILNDSLVTFSIPKMKSMLTFVHCLSRKAILMFAPDDEVVNLESASELDKLFLDSLNSAAFDILQSLLIENPYSKKDEFAIQRLHHLITDVPFLFAPQVKDLREKCEESGRIITAYLREGIKPPELPQFEFRDPFDQFLQLVTSFYGNPLNNTSKEIWQLNVTTADHHGKMSIFNKLVRSTVETFTLPLLSVPIINLLTSFAITSPFHIFSLVKSNNVPSSSGPGVVTTSSSRLYSPASLRGHSVSFFSLDNFFSILHSYTGSLKEFAEGSSFTNQIIPLSVNSNHTSFGQTQTSSIFGNPLQGTAASSSSNIKSIASPQGGEGITTSVSKPVSTDIDLYCAILKLIETVVKEDKTVSQALADHQSYAVIVTLVSLISSPVPRVVKASALSCLGAFAQSNSAVAFTIWLSLEGILPAPQVAISAFSSIKYHQGIGYTSGPGGLQGPNSLWKNALSVEIADIEPRNEEYSVTLAFLSMVSSLLPHIGAVHEPSKQSILANTINFIVDAIFLKVDSRTFSKESEKWQLFKSCLDVIHFIFDSYDPAVDDTANMAAFSLMTQILQENVLFRGIMAVIENVLLQFESDKIIIPSYMIQESQVYQLQLGSLELALKTLKVVFHKRDAFHLMLGKLQGFPSAALSSPASLFCNISPLNKEPDRLAILIRLTSIPVTSIQLTTLSILRSLVREDSSISHLCLLQCQPFKRHHEDYILHGFVECSESDDPELRKQLLLLLLDLLSGDCLTQGHYGLAHKLLGFDRKLTLRPPGIFEQVFTCLHSIIGILEMVNDTSESVCEERSLCFQVIYSMCQSPDIRATVLRFLRTSYELLEHYMRSRKGDFALSDINNWRPNYLLELGWFWRVLSTEILTTKSAELKTDAEKYIKLFLGSDASTRVLNVTDPVRLFSHSHPSMPTWDLFDSNELSKVIKSVTDGTHIDLKALHGKLFNEVKRILVQYGQQSAQLHQEMKKILTYAASFNDSATLMRSKIEYFKGWRDVVEVILTTDSLEYFDFSTRCQILVDLIHNLTKLASTSSLIATLLIPVSSIILLATSKLSTSGRAVTSTQVNTSQSSTVASGSGTIRTPIESSINATHFVSTAISITRLLEASSSNDIWINFPRARINLYGSLLHVYRRLSKDESYAGYEYNLYSPRLISRVGKDALDSIDLVKILSLSILLESKDTSWVDDFSSDGTLGLLVNSLTQDDLEIKLAKCQKCPAYYSFESKIALFLKIASVESGAKLLIHLNLVSVLTSLETLEIYTYLLNRNEVCFNIYVAVMRLLVTLAGSTLYCEVETDRLGQFVIAKSPVLYAILKTSDSYRSSTEGSTALFLTTALISKLILYTDSETQKCYLSLVLPCSSIKNESESQIMVNILQGCVTFILANELTPIFAPSWDINESFYLVGQPSLGLLVSLITKCVSKFTNEDASTSGYAYRVIVESSLFLLWHHLILFMAASNEPQDKQQAIERLLARKMDVLSDSFFSHITNNIKTNTFVEALVRKFRRLLTFA